VPKLSASFSSQKNGALPRLDRRCPALQAFIQNAKHANAAIGKQTTLGCAPRRREPRAQGLETRLPPLPCGASDQLSRRHRKRCLLHRLPDPTTPKDRLSDKNHQLGQKLGCDRKTGLVLSKAIRRADADNTLTPNLCLWAELMALGARADVVMATEHAIRRMSTAAFAQSVCSAGIEDFPHMCWNAHQDDYVVACVVPRPYRHRLGPGAARAESTRAALNRNRDACIAHFERAGEIYRAVNRTAPTSALVAATALWLMSAARASPPRPGPTRKLRAAHSAQPAHPRADARLGNHCCLANQVAIPSLSLRARRTARRCRNVWGAGGLLGYVLAPSCADDTLARQFWTLIYFIHRRALAR